jgi:hypothetical protein
LSGIKGLKGFFDMQLTINFSKFLFGKINFGDFFRNSKVKNSCGLNCQNCRGLIDVLIFIRGWGGILGIRGVQPPHEKSREIHRKIFHQI